FQDFRELSLPDDDVHLAADAGVRQQLLNIHQARFGAIDFIFACSITEHAAGNRYFCVVNGQSTISIVMVRVTSARPSALRSPAPAKMTSCILPPRRVFALPSPITQARASTTLDLPEPLGPTTAQIPGSNLKVVADAKDLNPLSVNDFKCIVII